MEHTGSARVLVVDDDTASLHSLQEVLEKEGYEVFAASGGEEAERCLDRFDPDLVLTDLRMREVDGLHLLRTVRERNAEVPVIVMTAFTSMETAVDAIRQGAFDYLSKPFKLEPLRLLVRRALEQSALRRENRRLRRLVEQTPASPIIGRSPEMVEVYKLIARVAPLETTVLIQGESGTGKEIVARLLHEHSGRPGPFLAVNCGALAENLLESELFGHRKGAFTGAIASKAGLFEAAEDGTCFLDEIANTSLAMQMKLLRVLEAREVTPVGATESTPIKVRVIAAANQPLESLVKAGRFREDLLYRLRVVTIDLPPLRKRRGDIPLLVDHFVRHFSEATRKEIAVHESVYPQLSAYPWPGNVRELSHAVERAIALNSSGVLIPEDFAGLVSGQSERADEPAARIWPTLAEKERAYIREVLAACGDSVTQASQILDIDRRTLTRILQREDPSEPEK